MLLQELFVLHKFLGLHTLDIELRSCKITNDTWQCLAKFAQIKRDLTIFFLVCLLCGSTTYLSTINLAFFFTSSRSIIRLHGREKHDLFNIVTISEKHGNTINTCTPSTSWWKAIFKGGNIVSVNMLCLKISCILCSSLSLKSFKLNFGVIKLSVCINNFVIIAKQLKSFRKSWFRSVPFGQWGHDRWSISNEGGIFALAFEVLSNKFVNHSCCCSWI